MPTFRSVRSARRFAGAAVALLGLIAMSGTVAADPAAPDATDAASRIDGAGPLTASEDAGDDAAPSQLVVTRALPFDAARALVVDHTHGRVFVSGDDAVAVTDLDGTLVAYLEGHPGAAGMVIAGGSLYVAETTAGAIGRITLGATPVNAARIVTGLVSPREVAFAGGALWTVTGGCAANAPNTLTRIAIPDGTVTAHPGTAINGCTLLAGAGDRVFVAPGAPLGAGHAGLFDISTGSLVQLTSVFGTPAQPQDIALTDDGSLAAVAGYVCARSYATPTLSNHGEYGGEYSQGKMTTAVAFNPSGSLIALGRSATPNLSLYAAGNPNAVWNIDAGRSVVPNGIGFSGDGSRMYALAKRETAIFDLHVVDVNDATSQYGEFHPIDPQRMHDSRLAGDRITELNVTVAGRYGLPAAGVSAVAANVTVTEPSLAGYLSVYPTGQARPTASTLNFETGQTIPNMTIVGVGPDGAIALFASQPTHVIVDVVGWFGTAGGPSGSLYHALVPDRWFDTRTDPRGDGSIRSLGPGEHVLSSLTGGRRTSDAGISAVALNVTATNTTADSFLAVAPAGPPPPSSSLNWTAGETVPNAVITKLDVVGGRAQFTNRFGRTDVLADVFGYWDNGTTHAGKRFYPIAPNRLVDTRRGYLAPGSAMGRSDRLAGRDFVSVKANGGLPAGTTAVVLNITAVEPSEQGFLSSFPLGMDPADGLKTSIVNYMPGDVRPNMVIAPLGAGGEIVVANGSGGTIDIVVDITGYFR